MMKSVNAVLVSIAATGWLLAAGVSVAGPSTTDQSIHSQVIAAEHVQLEMQMIHLQMHEHFSAMHPAVLSLQHNINEIAKQETPQTARQVRREVAKQLGSEQIALETEYLRKQDMFTTQDPEMVSLQSQITYVKHLRSQFAKA